MTDLNLKKAEEEWECSACHVENNQCYFGPMLPTGEVFCLDCAPLEKCGRCGYKELILIPVDYNQGDEEWWCGMCEYKTPTEGRDSIQKQVLSPLDDDECSHRDKWGRTRIRYNDETMSGVNGWDSTCDLCEKVWW